MKQVIEELRSGTVKVVDAPVPQCGSGELLVRNVVSLVSPGTEKLMIEMEKKSLLGKALARPDLVRLAYEKAKREGFLQVFREAMQRLDEPMPLGYSCAGEVVQVGSAVGGFAVGDRVACAGSGYASHAEFVAVPSDLCVALPRRADGAPLGYEEASFVMLGGIALHGLRRAELTPGETVAVVGLGLIGLLIAQLARAHGHRVIGIDVSPDKVALARELGCDHAFQIGRDDVESAVASLTGGGVDAVILAAATEDAKPVQLAEKITRPRARIVLVGVSELSLTRKAFWDKELTFTVSKASGPSPILNPAHRALPPDLVRWTEKRNLEAFLRLVAGGAVNVTRLITHRFPIGEATDGYEMILEGRGPYIGVLIQYPDTGPPETRIPLPGRASADGSAPARGDLGVIGAGMFTRNILLPILRESPGVRFVGVATKSGVTSSHVGQRYGFRFATSDYAELLKDERVASVAIVTRHDLHARLVAEALRAGKNVFVEKPLCVRQEEIDLLLAAWRDLRHLPMFMVGFNRPYSPLSTRLKTLLAGRTSPLQAHFRVNAGVVPATHWTQDPLIGGGRIIGEVCHFVDYFQFLTDSDPVEVYAAAVSGGGNATREAENVALTILMADGSCGSITYTALGPKTFSRERLEVYWADSVAVLDDFRSLEYVHGSRRDRHRLGSQDLGYRHEIQEFIAGPVEPSAERFRRALATTWATLAAVESLRTKRPVRVRRVSLQEMT